ncbi:hypothetical protein VPHD249_0104 [Vibrio phage D249]
MFLSQSEFRFLAESNGSQARKDRNDRVIMYDRSTA